MSNMPSGIDEWAQTVAVMRGNAVEPQDERAVREAVATMWSALGRQGIPEGVEQMLIDAVEAGYGAALAAVRDGHLDDMILESRPFFIEDFADEV